MNILAWCFKPPLILTFSRREKEQVSISIAGFGRLKGATAQGYSIGMRRFRPYESAASRSAGFKPAVSQISNLQA